MDPLLPIFVLLSPLWWLLFLGASGLIVWALEEEKGRWATVSIFAAAILMTIFGSMPTLDWLKENQYTILKYVVGYVAAGVIWGYGWKWWLFCIDKHEKYEDKKRQWLRRQGHPDSPNIPDDLKIKWQNLLEADGNFSYELANRERAIEVKPRYYNHKARTLRWAVYWPWSVLWSLFHDVIRNVFRYFQRLFGGFMNRISDFVFRDLDKDFVKKDPPKNDGPEV